MARLGFEVPPSATGATSTEDDYRDRYMLVDAEIAGARGYHPDPADAAAQQAAAAGPSRSPSYITAATGRGTARINGVAVPDGGCQGAAQAQLNTGDDPSAGDFVADLEGWSWERSQQDSRIITVFRAWAACMARAGYEYRSPRDANNDPAFSTPRATPREIRTAVADVRCKRENDLVGLWAAVEAGYQQQAVAAHRGRLDRIARDIERRTAAAASIVPDAGR
jgi:hypothetical protein